MLQAVSKREDREEVTCEQEEEYRMWGLREKGGHVGCWLVSLNHCERFSVKGLGYKVRDPTTIDQSHF